MRARRQTVRCAVLCAAPPWLSRRVFWRTLDRVHANRAVAQRARLRVWERRVIVVPLRIRKLRQTGQVRRKEEKRKATHALGEEERRPDRSLQAEQRGLRACEQR